MNYFKESIEQPLQEKIPEARFIKPNLNQKSLEMLKKYIDEILKNDQNRSTSIKNEGSVH